MDPYDIARYDKVHLWIGTNLAPEPEYQHYFELDYNAELDEPAYRVCGFCKDIGIRWYDEDFIGIVPRAETLMTLDDLLRQAPVDSREQDRVKAKCTELGIDKANALFWYCDGATVISRPLKTRYNGLAYIGLFEGN